MAVAVATWFFVDDLLVLPPWHREFDLKVYRGAVLWWLHHRPLYAFTRNRTGLGFTYPPFAAVLMVPLAWMSLPATLIVSVVLNAAVLCVVTWGLVTPLAARRGWSRWTAVGLAVPLAVALEPIRETLGYGQVNLFLMVLVLLDAAALRRGRRWAGAGIGLATAIKLTPALFVVYLLVTGRRRPAAVATGTFLAAGLLGMLVAPAASTQYWTRAVFQTSRVGPIPAVDNQSLLGLLARLGLPTTARTALWLLLGGAVAVVGLLRARRAHHTGDELAGLTLTGLTVCLVAPISWTHHLTWVLPAVLILAAHATDRSPERRRMWRRAWAALAAVLVYAIFASSMIWYVADPAGYLAGTGPRDLLVGDAYVFVLVALVLALPWRAGRLGEGYRPAGGAPAPSTAATPGLWMP